VSLLQPLKANAAKAAKLIAAVVDLRNMWILLTIEVKARQHHVAAASLLTIFARLKESSSLIKNRLKILK